MYRYEEPECLRCDQKENALQDVKYWMLYLLEQLYSEKAIDCDEIERCLMEISAVVDIKFPVGELGIERKHLLEPKHISNDVDKWLEWNQLYLKQYLQSH